MKTDTIFYSLFQAFPSIFFELIHHSPDEALNYEFTSREIKQLAFRLDGLFLPTTNEPEKSFYLVEVQFQPDPDLYYRLFGELFLYLKQYKPPHPWRVVVIYPSRSIEREEALQFGELLALERVTRIYLDELGEAAESSLGVGVVKLVIEPEATAGQQARRLIEQARQQLTDEAVQRELINLIETIIVYKLPQKSREEIAAMLGLSDLKNTRFYQEVLEEGKQEGKQEGIQEGIHEGERKAKLKAIPRMLELNLSFEVMAQILDLPLAAVQEMVQSFYVQNFAVFIELLNNQRSLFSPQDLAQLTELISPLPDGVEELSGAIALWYKNRPRILEAQQKLLQSVQEGSLKSPDYPLNKQTLENYIANR